PESLAVQNDKHPPHRTTAFGVPLQRQFVGDEHESLVNLAGHCFSSSGDDGQALAAWASWPVQWRDSRQDSSQPVVQRRTLPVTIASARPITPASVPAVAIRNL